MDFKEVLEYGKRNQNALDLLFAATDDYLGARVCFLNGLIKQGYIFSQQAIEKILKSYILLVKPDEKVFKNKDYPNHDLNILLIKASVITNTNFTNYVNLCKTLTGTFSVFRYPSNEKYRDLSIKNISTELVHEVDEMFITLFINLSLPDIVKCRTGILSYLKVSKYEPYVTIIIRDNKAYLKNLDYFSKPLSWWQTNADKRPPDTTISAA